MCSTSAFPLLLCNIIPRYDIIIYGIIIIWHIWCNIMTSSPMIVISCISHFKNLIWNCFILEYFYHTRTQSYTVRSKTCICMSGQWRSTRFWWLFQIRGAETYKRPQRPVFTKRYYGQDTSGHCNHWVLYIKIREVLNVCDIKRAYFTSRFTHGTRQERNHCTTLH